jgi:hypothetical protein
MAAIQEVVEHVQRTHHVDASIHKAAVVVLDAVGRSTKGAAMLLPYASQEGKRAERETAEYSDSLLRLLPQCQLRHSFLSPLRSQLPRRPSRMWRWHAPLPWPRWYHK